MHFHQLGACKRKCFRLAGIVILEGNSRQELIETLATGKYPTFANFIQALVVQAPQVQALVVQALVFQH